MFKEGGLARNKNHQKPEDSIQPVFDLSKIDPYHDDIENPQEIIEHAVDLLEIHPEQVIEFSLKALYGLGNQKLGIEIANYIIRQKGWD